MAHHATHPARSTALSPACPDAELIATCAAFCELERASDVVRHGFAGDLTKERAGDAELAKIVAKQDALVERMIALPCTSIEGVQAMATALATWDRELLKNGPARDVGEAITSNLVERLLALGHSDSDLMAVCSEFCASEAAFCAIYDGPYANDDAASYALAKPIADSWDGMLDRMAQLRATTAEGLAARAIALSQHSGLKPGQTSYGFAFAPGDEQGGVTGRLLHMLLSDAVRMIGGPLPVPDTELLALQPEFDRLHALMIDYNKDLIPDGGTECADFDALCDRIASAEPAATAEGRAFQAAAAMHHLTYRLTDCEQVSSPVWLLLKGIAGNAYQSVEARA